MKYKCIVSTWVFIFSVLSILVGRAQESNAKTDFTSYLPEIRALNNMLSHAPQGASMLTPKGLQDGRNMLKTLSSRKTILHPTTKSIGGPARPVTVRIFMPDTIKAVVLDIHGGAWCQGDASIDDFLNDEMARICHVAVVSVDYRLAPEFPFPACIEDCKTAAKWLVANEKKEFGTDRFLLSGASAGAHLAALTAIFIRDSLQVTGRMIGINLLYGCYDLSRTPSNRQTTDTTPVLPKKSMNEVSQLIFNKWNVETLQLPAYSPLYANLKNLAPAIFTVGTNDPLLDDTNFMESRWRNAGNKTYLAVYPECTHGLNIMPTKIAGLANAAIYSWINDLLL